MYIKVKEAAQIMGITIQSVYQAIRYTTLKAKKINDVLYTTNEWIEEYRKHLCSKQEHSRYNGRNVFDKEKGEYSLQMASEMTSIPVHTLYYMIDTGKIKAFRRGVYWVITDQEIQRACNILEEKRKTA